MTTIPDALMTSNDLLMTQKVLSLDQCNLVFIAHKFSLGLKKKFAFCFQTRVELSDQASAGNRFPFLKILLLPWCVILPFEIVAIRTNYLKSGE